MTILRTANIYHNNDSCSKYFLTIIIDACMNVDLIIKNLQKRYDYNREIAMFEDIEFLRLLGVGPLPAGAAF